LGGRARGGGNKKSGILMDWKFSRRGVICRRGCEKVQRD